MVLRVGQADAQQQAWQNQHAVTSGATNYANSNQNTQFNQNLAAENKKNLIGMAGDLGEAVLS